jgi:hypothetical protein
MRCIECPTAEGSAPAHETVPVDDGIAGGSARAEFARRAGKRDAQITERWGTGFMAKAVRALTDEPQSTRAWAIGAAGEEKLARVLADVPGLRILHDRRVPGTKANIDHLLVASAGVFVVDAKAHKGIVEIRNRGWIWSPDYRLTVGRRDCSALADNMGWQVEAVRTALADLEPAPPITPVLCFLEAEWPLFRPPDEFRGVRLEGSGSLKRLASKLGPLKDGDVERIVSVLRERLPAK